MFIQNFFSIINVIGLFVISLNRQAKESLTLYAAEKLKIKFGFCTRHLAIPLTELNMRWFLLTLKFKVGVYL
jgi:hypothetical protein